MVSPLCFSADESWEARRMKLGHGEEPLLVFRRVEVSYQSVHRSSVSLTLRVALSSKAGPPTALHRPRETRRPSRFIPRPPGAALSSLRGGPTLPASIAKHWIT